MCMENLALESKLVLATAKEQLSKSKSYLKSLTDNKESNISSLEAQKARLIQEFDNFRTELDKTMAMYNAILNK